MIDRVSDKVHERVRKVFDHDLVELRLLACSCRSISFPASRAYFLTTCARRVKIWPIGPF